MIRLGGGLAQFGHRDTFSVAITGYGQEEDRRRSRAAGFDAHPVKPAHPDALAKLLAENSDRAGHARS